MMARLFLALLSLLPLSSLGASEAIGTRDGVVTAPNRTLTFPMQVRFSDLVATGLATSGYSFPQALGAPGQGLTVSADGLSLIFKAADVVGDMLKSVYDADNNLAADSADALGGLLATNYATRAWVVDQIAAIPPVDLSSYATRDWVTAAIAAIPPVDLSDYVTTAELDEALAEIPLHDPVTSGDDFVAVAGQVLTLNTNAMDVAGFAMDSAVAGAIAAAHPAFSLAPGTVGDLAGQEYSLQAADITAVTDLLYAVIGHGHAASDVTSGVFDLARIPTNVATDVELADAIAAIPPVDLSDYVTGDELATELGLLPWDDFALVDHVHDAGDIASGVFDMLQMPGDLATDVEVADAVAAIATHDAVTLDPNSVGSLTGQTLLISTNAVGEAARSTVTGTADGTKYLRDDWSWQTVAAGGLGGTTGGADNYVLRADGAGGSTVQTSSIRIDDPTAATQQNVALVNMDTATDSALVLTPKGAGAFILGPRPDRATSGGNARGADSVDLQLDRLNSGQVVVSPRSFAAGSRNTVNNNISAAVGYQNSVTGGNNAIYGAYAFGSNNSGGGNGTTNCGNGNAIGNVWYAGAFGNFNSVWQGNSYAYGSRATINHQGSVVVGANDDQAVSSDRTKQFKVRADGGMTHQTDGGTMTMWGKRSSAPVSGVNAGDIYYNTTTNVHYGYNGSTWNAFY